MRVRVYEKLTHEHTKTDSTSRFVNLFSFKCHGVSELVAVKSRPYLWDVGSSFVTPVMSIYFHLCHQLHDILQYLTRWHFDVNMDRAAGDERGTHCCYSWNFLLHATFEKWDSHVPLRIRNTAVVDLLFGEIQLLHFPYRSSEQKNFQVHFLLLFPFESEWRNLCAANSLYIATFPLPRLLISV